MKVSKSLFVVFLLISFSCKSQRPLSRIEIVQPTIAQEATSIWRTINDVAFFEKQGYTIHLPKHPLIDSLLSKSKNGTFGNKDFPAIHALVEAEVFNQKNYKKAIQKVDDQLDLINGLVNEMDTKKEQWDWKFNMFETYRVVFTLYGTGGSYDPDTGSITLLTNSEGGFMNYEQPANTIIHEIVHMGVEYSIVQKYNLSHGLKERLVDRLVHLMFKEELPEYRIQNMGNVGIDEYLKKPEDIGSLNVIIPTFLNK